MASVPVHVGKQTDRARRMPIWSDRLPPLHHEVDKVGVHLLADAPVQRPEPPIRRGNQDGRRGGHDAASDRSHAGVLIGARVEQPQREEVQMQHYGKGGAGK